MVQRRKSYRLSGQELETRALPTTLFINTQESVGESFIHHDAALGDVDGDGDLDAFIASDSRGTHGSPNQVWLNDGDGHFFDSGQRLGQASSRSIELGDMDGDGDLDAFVANDRGVSNEIWLNNGDGTFTASAQDLASTQSPVAALGDLDGDGDLDVFVSERLDSAYGAVWLNNGSGLFLDSGQRFDRSTSEHVVLGDIDGDDDLDVVLSQTILLNDGQGNLLDTGQTLVSHRAFRPGAIALGDVDGDGDLDAFVANIRSLVLEGFEASNEVWLNDGNGNFSDSGQRLSLGGSHLDASLADVDGDGDLDAVVSGRVDEVFLNDGSGTFLLVTDLQNTGHSVSLGDLDGDDDVDIFILDHRNIVRVWLNEPAPGDANGDFRFDERDILQVIEGGKYLTGESATFAEGDFNVDGVFDQLDLILALQGGNYHS